MKKPALPNDFACPVEAALDVIGGKWKSIILYYLMEHGILRFGELRRRLPARITPQMLTNQLRELEQDGVVKRKAYERMPPKVEYSLTPFGKTLCPLMKELCLWGAKHEARVRARFRGSD